MKTLCGFAVAGVLALAALFTLGPGQAFAAQVSCGQVITQDTRVGNDLIDCPGDGLVVGADGITLDLNATKIRSGPMPVSIGVTAACSSRSSDGSTNGTSTASRPNESSTVATTCW